MGRGVKISLGKLSPTAQTKIIQVCQELDTAIAELARNLIQAKQSERAQCMTDNKVIAREVKELGKVASV